MSDEHPVVWTKDKLRERLKALWLDMPDELYDPDVHDLQDYPRIRDYIKDLYCVLEIDLTGLRLKVRDLQVNAPDIFWVPQNELVKGFERIE